METRASAAPKSVSFNRNSRFKLEAPWLIMLALLMATLVSAYQSYQRTSKASEARFSEIARIAQESFTGQLRDTESLLRSASVMITTVPDLQVRQWAYFFASHRESTQDYRGLSRIEYVYAGGRSGPRLTQDFDTRLEKSAVQPIEKIPVVAEAIQRVNQSRTYALSDPFVLSESAAARQNLMVMVMPVQGYAVDDRVRVGEPWALTGYLLATISLDDLVGKLTIQKDPRLIISLVANNRQLYRSEVPASTGGSRYSSDIALNFSERPWTMRFESSPALERELANTTPQTILLVGCLGTLLLGGMIWLLSRLREQAESLATKMTERLQDQVKFTEDLIEFNPNPITRKDAAGRYVTVNRAWEILTGHKRKNVLGKTIREFADPAQATRIEAQDQRVYESDSGYDAAEFVVNNPNGQRFETIFSKQLLRRADGSIDGSIGTITDVTPIKKLEQELAQKREQLDMVIGSSQQGIWDVELHQGGNIYLSEKFLEMLGYAGVRFPNIDWPSALHPEDVETFKREMARHFKRESPYFDVEARARRRNGDYLWVRVRAIAQHNAHGRAVRFVGSIGDISDRKQAEATLIEANERVVEAAQAKAAFLATMSHEIRTPLNGVLGMAGLLAETRLNSEQTDFIRLIRASGDTLLRLVDDVLDFSKIESGRMTLETVPVELIQLIEEAFELVADKARAKQLALIYDLNDDVPAYILGDATRLRQILLNLLSNAIKFTAHGEIALRFSATHVTGDVLVLEGSVSDTGIGIPADRIGQLFQAFTQVDASTTRKYGGTGLGLAIIKRLTQLMNGDVRAESVEGEGTTFIFTITTQVARGPLRPYMQSDVFDFLGKRLLVVESASSRRPILQKTMSRWGFECVVLPPEEAAAALRAQPGIDIFISDLNGKGPHAVAAREAIDEIDRARAQAGERPLVSILVSNVSRAELSRRSEQPSIRHDIFLMRPVGQPKLFEALMRAALRDFHTDIGSRPLIAEPDEESIRLPDQPYNANISAPLATDVTVDGVTSRTANAEGRPLEILVAEDNEINQRVISGMLKNLGHRVTLVDNGRAAVTAAGSRQFDVVLTDIHMPELDGIATMRELHALLNDRCPPIAAMTAHALAGDREHYLNEGMDDYISKPIRKAELCALLERMAFISDVAVAPSPFDISPAHNFTSPAVAMLPARTNLSAVNARIEALPVLDTEQLEDLRYLPASSGDPDDGDAVGGLIRLFQSKGIERMAIMERCLAENDWAALAETAHSLRGASASMGFPRVASICKDLELGARKRAKPEVAPTGADATNLDELFASIRHYYREADTALAIWLSDSQPTSAQAGNIP